ncbi:WD40 repeat domain-containing protein [Lignipirellula cremea]|uniref:WD domain, G-beta repeat n=1 Tax=Lignipirellula cremea TaxID=2528010 RepID=A0A518DPF0_9BACT|nr:WD40 repeat domain-containing protein [Lignipirellula cremea]QDU93727.1 WD domain, G-beta repeat [Lignipirellula cremea]
MHRMQTCWAICLLGLCAVGMAPRPAAAQTPADMLPPVVTAVKMQPGGDLFATAGDDHLVRIWNRETGELERRLDGHLDWVRTVAFSPDGAALVTGGNDRTIVVWNPATGEQLAQLGDKSRAIASMAFSPDGKTLAVVGFEQSLQLFDFPAGTLNRTLDCPCRDMRCVAFSPNGTLLASAGRTGQIRLWNVAAGDQPRDLPVHRRRVRGMAFSPDGSQIASASEGGEVRITAVDSGQGFELPRLSAKALSLVYVDRNTLAVGCSDNTIRIWNLSNRTEIKQLRGHTGSVSTLDSDKGTLISGSFDASQRQWPVGGSGAAGPQLGGLPANRK